MKPYSNILHKSCCSVTELAEGGSDGTLGIRGVLEGHIVAGAPRELSAETGVDTLLDVGIGSDVTDFLLGGLEGLEAGVQFPVLKHGEGADVANVAHSLELVQMLSVVNEVEHEVVLHSNIKSLHLLGLGTTSLRDGALDGVLSLHELVELSMDVINDTWGVDGVLVTLPVDGFLGSGGGVFVVVIKNSLELTVSVTGGFVGCASSDSLEPVGSKVLVYCNRAIVSRLSLVTYFWWPC